MGKLLFAEIITKSGRAFITQVEENLNLGTLKDSYFVFIAKETIVYVPVQDKEEKKFIPVTLNLALKDTNKVFIPKDEVTEIRFIEEGSESEKAFESIINISNQSPIITE